MHSSLTTTRTTRKLIFTAAALLTALGVVWAAPWGDVEYTADGVARFNGFRFNEVTAPGAPPANQVALYSKNDGLLYSKDDAGVETQVSGGAGGGGFTIGIPASAFVGAVGDASIPAFETQATSGVPMLSFSGTADEDCLAWQVTLPDAYDNSANTTFEIVLFCDAGVSQQTRYTIEVSNLEGADLDAALVYDTAQAVVATTSATQGVSTTHAWTVANADMDTPAAGDAVVIRLTRTPTHGDDTSVLDTHVVTLRLYQ